MSDSYFSKCCCSHLQFHNNTHLLQLKLPGKADVCCCCWCWWIEINCSCCRFYTDWSTGDKNIFHRTSCPSSAVILRSLLSHFPFSSPPISTSSLSSLPPRALSRAVMGLDREPDVVHIETRIAKGRECCTPVRRCSNTHRTPLPLSFRARSRGRWDPFCCPDWSLKSSKAE